MSALSSFFKNLFSKNTKSTSLEDLQGEQRTDALLQNLVSANRIPGMAVTITKHGEILLQKGYGFANLEQETLVEPNKTIFRIASISKCITGLAFGKMMEEGLLDLDASFYDYVPYYPKKKYDFSLRQLATHTAGIRGYRGKEFALNAPNSIKDSIAIFKDDPLVFEPGKGYLYNSFDFVLLSLAMQEASQTPFEIYVKEAVLEPLGMNNTFAPHWIDKSTAGEYLANFYTKTLKGFREAVPVDNFYKIAGGGFLSTSADIARMGHAISKGDLLQRSTYDKIFTSQTVEGGSVYYGLGFQVSEDIQGRRFIGHVGNSVGAYTNFFVYPDKGVAISIMINCTDPKVQEELDNAIQVILDLPSS